MNEKQIKAEHEEAIKQFLLMLEKATVNLSILSNVIRISVLCNAVSKDIISEKLNKLENNLAECRKALTADIDLSNTEIQ